MNYTYDELNGKSVHTLRIILRDINGVPGTSSKDTLIRQILSIQSGEITPERSPRGRKPIDYHMDINRLNLPHADELDFSDVEDNARFTSEGVVEIRRYNCAFLHNVNCSLSVKDFYIVPEIVENFSLKNGDIIVAESVKSSKTGLVMVENVLKVNGEITSQVGLRKDISAFSPKYPTERITLYQDGKSEVLKQIDYLCPIGKGQRCLVCMKERFQLDVLKDVLESVSQNENFYINVLLVGVKPEDITELSEINHCVVTVIKAGEDEKDSIRKMNLFFDKTHRLVEFGKNVVSVVCYLDSVIGIYDNIEKTLEEKQPFVDGQSVVKKNFALSGDYGENGSLTFIGCIVTESADSLYRNLSNLATCEIKIESHRGRRQVVNISESFTVKDEYLLTEEELKIAEKMRNQ